MINKSNLWFLTLTSIILVLAVYYIAFPNDKTEMVFSPGKNTSVITSVSESEAITAMRVEKEEETIKEIQALQEILLNTNKNVDEKNHAYEQIQNLNANKATEEKIEKIISSEFKVSCFIQIKDNNIKVVVANKKDTYELANNIINRINKELNNSYYVTVKFE